MLSESNTYEKKSIKIIRGKNTDYKKLSELSVGLANAEGGRIVIGIEDKSELPPENQTIEQFELNELIKNITGRTYNIYIIKQEIITASNNGQYIEIFIGKNEHSIASTKDGKIFIRICDNTTPVRPEDISHLASLKNTFQWESVKKFDQNLLKKDRIEKFVQDIKSSERVKSHIKNKSDMDILDHYRLIRDGRVTNLGILWLGDKNQTDQLLYPLNIQYVVYDESEKKVRKEKWFYEGKNPHEILIELEAQAFELTYEYEVSIGLYRDKIRYYSKEIIRELFVNAIAHRSYTSNQDIIIEVRPDSLTVENPGGLPFGITPENILQNHTRRNPYLMKIMEDLKLMEGEGSGYDLIYEKLCLNGKSLPIIYSDYNKFSVSICSRIVDENALQLINFLNNNYQLKQKDIITLGIIAQKRKIDSVDLSKLLQLSSEERLRSWVTTLLSQNILVQDGIKKGTSYQINPKLYQAASVNVKPTLITIDKHQLSALILQDLVVYPNSSINDIKNRINDIPQKNIRASLLSLISQGLVNHTGGTRYRKYFLAKKQKGKK